MTWTPPGFILRPVRNVYSAGTVTQHFRGDVPNTRGLVLHVQDGNGGLFGWFDNPKSLASSAWWAGKNGEREQYGDPDTERFWTQAAGNWDWHAVECEGKPDEPMTAAQVETVAQILAAGHDRYGWPLETTDDPDGAGLGWHGMGAPAWGHAYCPGDIRKAQMPAVVARAKAIAGEKEPPVPSTTANGWPVQTSVPGPTFTAPTGDTPDVADDSLGILFAYLAYRLHTEVGPLTNAWGGRTWAQQMATNPRVTTSNHLSFTACDMPIKGINGYGSRTSGLSWAQERQIDRILGDITGNGKRIFQWGNDFLPPDGDPVHWQVMQLKPYGAGPYPAVVTLADVRAAAGTVRAWVQRVQAAVDATVDGYAGPGLLAKVKAWQKTQGLVVDGIFGPASERAAGWTKPKPAPKPKSPHLTVDGDFGKASVRALTEALGTPVDDVISSQSTSYRRNLHGITAIEYVAPSKARGSKAVVALQKRCGIKHPTGRLTKPTIRAVQRHVKVKADGYWGKVTSEAVQRALNAGTL